MPGWTAEQDQMLIELKDSVPFVDLAKSLSRKFGKRISKGAVAGRLKRLGLGVSVEVRKQRFVAANAKWTPEQDDALREGLETLCYRDIATFINHKFGTDFTKDAIVGRTKRLGLSAAKRPVLKVNLGPDGFVPRVVRTDSRRKTILELGAMECRWADDDRNADGLHTFCGNRTGDGSSYCPAHAELNRGVGTPSERNAVNVLRKAAA